MLGIIQRQMHGPEAAQRPDCWRKPRLSTGTSLGQSLRSVFRPWAGFPSEFIIARQALTQLFTDITPFDVREAFSSIGITAQRDELCYHPRLRT
jgi:hypothetical protein